MKILAKKVQNFACDKDTGDALSMLPILLIYCNAGAKSRSSKNNGHCRMPGHAEPVDPGLASCLFVPANRSPDSGVLQDVKPIVYPVPAAQPNPWFLACHKSPAALTTRT